MIRSAGVNDEVRRTIKAELARKGIQYQEAADRIGVTPNHLSRMLSDRAKSGELPESWQKLLDLVDLELVVRSKDG